MTDPARRAAPSPLAPLAPIPWILFLVFTAVGFVVMPLGIGEYEVRRWIAHPPIEEAAARFLALSDALWIVLAATSVYLELARREGIATARRWAAILLAGSALLEWVGETTGFPFGPYAYTDRFGHRIGGVLPFTIPLAWFLVVIGGRHLVAWLFPRLAPLPAALAVGAVGLLTDLNLEFVAWKARAYWIWYPGDPSPPAWPPVQNYATWFVACAVFAWCLRGGAVSHPQPATRSIAVLALMNALFLAVHAARALRG